MAKQIKTLEEFHEYLDGVMSRAKCHAEEVQHIILPLAGWLLSKSHHITVREYNGTPANMLWFYIEEQRYCFYYDHDNECIKLLKDSCKGEVLEEFDNNNSLDDIFHLLD